jgi:uncharacterized damage-inducible protein DinB
VDLKEYFLKQKQTVNKGTLDVIAKIPPDQAGWRPAQGMLSLGELVRHLWMSEEGIRRLAIDSDWSYYEKRIPQGLFAILGEVTSLGPEVTQIERIHEDTLIAVRDFPLERWEEDRRNEQFNFNRKVWTLLFGINEHQIHHRAQIGTCVHILTGGRASPYPI